MKKIDTPVQLIDQVYDAILNAICSGAIAPNERITQEGLALQLGVSRQPILQAIHLLKLHGFITDAGKKGVMVTALEPVQLMHLYQIRAALDSLAARQAAKCIREAECAESILTGRALIQVGFSLEANGTTSDLIKADINFHQHIYQMSGNPMITQTTALHWHHIRRAMGAILGNEVRLRRQVWREHEAIFDAICQGDIELAGTLASQHAESAAAHLANILQHSEKLMPHKQV
jgi:DNA-binding GntR family transcriptional regulator